MFSLKLNVNVFTLSDSDCQKKLVALNFAYFFFYTPLSVIVEYNLLIFRNSGFILSPEEPIMFSWLGLFSELIVELYI